ncbi:quinolinate synthetase complex, A subunit [Geobacter metallireducens RCH3]|uniref:Quinolinate synthase n=1 Tax=Geobacter metallireducens (strain ATCC 53774 / DSM 7210 / GS-15) TaxID=269799 RepID=NADA_GEOMG|nr:quinolinate synthase NadA [Geobacter metallireducens]Q39PS5.1 RecName: Full=Quinolinate synthase [Geobacter metallireducens GS-15]ABB33749.1 quinolinate synthetase complex, subunit A [Geobacter metallireducens GS-15]EHP85729.1 quinolinate synthetase complex, A subunit [Geobacter metallireducens RCH3]
MQADTIKQEIRRLLKERNAVLLAHNYMRDEVQEIADITGDSLGLSQEAAKTAADVIVFCGVHFMAESASILSPHKTVLLPRRDAGCPMADMVTVEGLLELKARHPGVPVVTYVNSSAAVKAVSDICCTSANAVKVVNSLPDREVIFVPDRNLGQFVAKQSDKAFHFWDGYCPTHERLKADVVARLKAENPDALFICHPECNPAVVALADHACSTSGMYDYCRKSPAKRFIIGTEAGILYKLRLENPDKEFILASPALVCPNMKLTSLEDILDALTTMAPVVQVPEDIRVQAKRALDRMIAIPRD